MTAFAPLLGLLEEVPDHRRAEGKVYQLAHVLLFSILAIVSGGNSYRSIVTFIESTHPPRGAYRAWVKPAFDLTGVLSSAGTDWRRNAQWRSSPG